MSPLEQLNLDLSLGKAIEATEEPKHAFNLVLKLRDRQSHVLLGLLRFLSTQTALNLSGFHLKEPSQVPLREL
jgi:hypothetical protein